MMNSFAEILLVLFNRNMLSFTGSPQKRCIISPKENCCSSRRFCRVLLRINMNNLLLLNSIRIIYYYFLSKQRFKKKKPREYHPSIQKVTIKKLLRPKKKKID